MITSNSSSDDEFTEEQISSFLNEIEKANVEQATTFLDLSIIIPETPLSEIENDPHNWSPMFLNESDSSNDEIVHTPPKQFLNISPFVLSFNSIESIETSNINHQDNNSLQFTNHQFSIKIPSNQFNEWNETFNLFIAKSQKKFNLEIKENSQQLTTISSPLTESPLLISPSPSLTPPTPRMDKKKKNPPPKRKTISPPMSSPSSTPPTPPTCSPIIISSPPTTPPPPPMKKSFNKLSNKRKRRHKTEIPISNIVKRIAIEAPNRTHQTIAQILVKGVSTGFESLKKTFQEETLEYMFNINSGVNYSTNLAAISFALYDKKDRPHHGLDINAYNRFQKSRRAGELMLIYPQLALVITNCQLITQAHSDYLKTKLHERNFTPCFNFAKLLREEFEKI